MRRLALGTGSNSTALSHIEDGVFVDQFQLHGADEAAPADATIAPVTGPAGGRDVDYLPHAALSSRATRDRTEREGRRGRPL